MAILEVKNLVKTYAGRRVVDGVSFSLTSGEILGLLGPNGAGKTTTIDMILGLVEPTEGEILIPPKEHVNFAATYAHLPGNMSVRENLKIFSYLYEIADRPAAIAHALKAFDLEKFANHRTGFLSSGEQTRLGIAKSLLNHPQLLLLDEPTASLDPSTAEDIRRHLLDYVRTEHASVLWTSHDMTEITRVCDRVLFISRGKIVLEGNPRELPQQQGKKDLEELFIHVAHENL
ncbi:MAG: ABC transporter ATP-binding protein [Patescibacteria group bacterium]